MTLFAILFITAALVLYTVGVWAEHRQRTLRPWHAVMFLAGLACDTTGTVLMGRIQESGLSTQSGPLTSLMMVTGAIALLLMLFHAAWAVIVLLRNRPAELATFHRLSVIVWAIWLVPYIAGALDGMIEG